MYKFIRFADDFVIITDSKKTTTMLVASVDNVKKSKAFLVRGQIMNVTSIQQGIAKDSTIK